MKNTRKIVLTGLCIAIGLVLPQLLHTIPQAGSIFLPMHIPVLLCGLLCGPVFGLACGVATPLLSSLITGMPPAAILPGMLCELAVYGLVAGLLIKAVKTKSSIANLYIALIGAMICGRITYGILNSLIFMAGKYSMELWLTAAFVKALPGIVIQLVLIPAVVTVLKKVKLTDVQ